MCRLAGRSTGTFRARETRAPVMSFHSTPPKRTPAPSLPASLVRGLMQDGDAAQIVLGDRTHTLRIARAGKLTLTK